MQTDPAVLSSRGESIAVAAVKKIGQKISLLALQRKNQANKDLVVSARPDSSTYSASVRPKNGVRKGSCRKRKRAASMAISTSDVDEHQVEAIEAVTMAAASDGEQGISNGQEEQTRSQDHCGEPHSSDPLRSWMIHRLIPHAARP